MAHHDNLKQRLARLEQKYGSTERTIAPWLDSEYGRLLLELLPPDAREAALLGGAISVDLQYPPLRAHADAEAAAYRVQRGMPPFGSESHLG